MEKNIGQRDALISLRIISLVTTADETEVYWWAIDDGTLTFNTTKATGNKVSYSHLILLFVCNMKNRK